MLEAHRLDLERPDPVAGRDDHVVRPALVPDVAVLVARRGVAGVEPLTAECRLGVGRPVPVAERIVRVGAGPEADLATLAGADRLLVLVEDRDLPAGHRTAHRTLPHGHPRVVGDQRIRLGQPVVVEHRDPVLVAEPPDRLRVQRLSRRAHPPEPLRVALAGVGHPHHRPHRGRRREHVGDAVSAQEVELAVGVEPGLPAVHVLHRAQPPRARGAARSRPPTPIRPCRGRPPRRQPRGSTRTPRGRADTGGRARPPSPSRSYRTCSRAGRGRRPRCRTRRGRAAHRRTRPRRSRAGARHHRSSRTGRRSPRR